MVKSKVKRLGALQRHWQGNRSVQQFYEDLFDRFGYKCEQVSNSSFLFCFQVTPFLSIHLLCLLRPMLFSTKYNYLQFSIAFPNLLLWLRTNRMLWRVQTVLHNSARTLFPIYGTSSIGSRRVRSTRPLSKSITEPAFQGQNWQTGSIIKLRITIWSLNLC